MMCDEGPKQEEFNFIWKQVERSTLQGKFEEREVFGPGLVE
jgi:hypothetical protein